MLGLSTDFAKLAPGAGLPPLGFLAWSLVGGTLVLTLVGAVRGRLPALNGRTVEYFLVAGFLGLAAPNLIFFSAVPHVGASFVVVSLALSPLYTYAGALLLGMERFDVWRASGVVLTLAGSKGGQGGLYRFESLDGGFKADLPVDADGLVVDYPGLSRRALP